MQEARCSLRATTNLVSGAISYDTCEHERRYGACGPAGHNWKAKPSPVVRQYVLIEDEPECKPGSTGPTILLIVAAILAIIFVLHFH